MHMRGKRTQLAEYLDVSPSRVSEWLAGKRQPGGEVTLAMQEWVTEAERQSEKLKQKGPRRVRAQRGQTSKGSHKHVHQTKSPHSYRKR